MTKVAAIQMDSFPSVQESLQVACELITQAAKQGAKLAALPENFATLRLTQEETVALAEPFQQGILQQQLSQCARQNNIWLVGGTLPLQSNDKQKIFSSCLVWDNQGACVGRYDKVHLFDVSVGAQETYLESAHVAFGEQLLVVPTPFGKLGIAICYDLRFPELFRALAFKGAEIILLPSAFTIPTGEAHWEILLKARAIENLCYIIAPNEVGKRANDIGTYGHSLIIGPWGDTLAQIEKGSGVITADVDLTKLHQLRQRFPALTHHRSFIFADLHTRGNT